MMSEDEHVYTILKIIGGCVEVYSTPEKAGRRLQELLEMGAPSIVFKSRVDSASESSRYQLITEDLDAG
ncbi:MAG: hypothetical protein KC931_10065 [Candidatus Omnitrophica bacterium]|nr:hypothetical protein [Candidatus Omnitrophota bacterium]